MAPDENAGSLTAPYTHQKLRRAPDDAIEREIDAQFKQYDDRKGIGGADKLVFLFQAQLLMGELASRGQDKQACLMNRYTKQIMWFTVAIGLMTAIQVGFGVLAALRPTMCGTCISQPLSGR